MTYATEFPDMANDTACAVMAGRADAWEDTSWHNDVCPSFTCDVFRLWVDHEDTAQREVGPDGPRFVMMDEDRTVLETNDWGDVLAYMDEGNRWGPHTGLNREFMAWTAAQGFTPEDGDAEEILRFSTKTPEQAAWLQDFITRWDATPYAYDNEAQSLDDMADKLECAATHSAGTPESAALLARADAMRERANEMRETPHAV